MLDHICRKDKRDNSFSNIFLVFNRKSLKNVEALLVHKFRRSSNMMILKNRNIVISKRKLMLFVDHEHVVVPGMLKIMDRSCKYHWKEIDWIQLSSFHPIRPHHEIVHCLSDIRGMCFVVIWDKVISSLDSVNKFDPNVKVNFKLRIDRMLLKNERSESN